MGIFEDRIEFLRRLYTFDVDPKLVIAHRYKIQSVREQSRNSEGSILIIRDDRSPVKFEEESTLFHSIDEAQKDEYLDFYAPVTFIDEKDKRRRNREYAESIRDIVERALDYNKSDQGSENHEGEGRIPNNA